jgi:hypothetical protein
MFFGRKYLVAEKIGDGYAIKSFENLREAYGYYLKDITGRAILKAIDVEIKEEGLM